MAVAFPEDAVQQVTVHAAKAHLSRLIEAALRGEEVVIARGSRPVVRLVPVRRAPFRIGILAGQLGTPPDFSAPMEPEDLALREGGA